MTPQAPVARPELAHVTAVVHGAAQPADLAAHAVPFDEAIDFSASTNPLGPPPGVGAALRDLATREIGRYPDPTAAALRHALAQRLRVDAEDLIAGNGSSEIIWLLALAYARPAPERVLIVGPTYGEYERAAHLMGARVERLDARAEDAFAVDLPALAKRVREAHPRLVWLCNPNNPTGTYLRRAGLESVHEACAHAGALLVVDEAYLPFVPGADSLIGMVESGHTFLLRSMTKDYALAGLRLGYGIGPRGVVAQLRLAQPPWSVGAAAQAAGLAALADDEHLERSRREVWAAGALLVDGLRRLGYGVVPPAANFLLVEVGDGWESAAALRRALLAKRCVVRDCASFGLPRHVRIGVRTRAECGRLLAALEELAQ